MVLPIMILVFFLGALPFEAKILYNCISGVPSSLEEWLGIFKHSSSWIVGSSLFGAVIWYMLAQWIYKINNWPNADKRDVWCMLMLIPLFVAMIAAFSMPWPQEGKLCLASMFFLNTLIPYYAITAPFSPSSFKYVPIGAQLFRRWW